MKGRSSRWQRLGDESGAIAARAIAFVAIVSALYFGAFYGVEYWQRRLGPWMITFASDAGGNPSIVIYQPKLGISSVELLLLGETAPASNLHQRVTFNQHQQQGPFGRVVYEDLRSLPGVITLNLFNHEVELRPRTLVVNRREIPWQSEQVIELTADSKPPTPLEPPKGRY